VVVLLAVQLLLVVRPVVVLLAVQLLLVVRPVAHRVILPLVLLVERPVRVVLPVVQQLLHQLVVEVRVHSNPKCLQRWNASEH
jgi:hypothetical protein